MAKASDYIDRLLAETDVFHEDWYCSAYDVSGSKRRNARDHFITEGFAKGYSPHPLFDPEWYLRQNADVAESGMLAFDHYMRSGAREGRLPSPLFDRGVVDGFMSPDAHAAEPLGLLSRFVRTDDLSVCLQFLSQSHYRDQSATTGAFNRDLEHFLCSGLTEGHTPHPLIVQWPGKGAGSLLDQYRAFAGLFSDDPALLVAKTHPELSPEVYSRANADVTVNPTIHYLRNWQTRTTSVHPLLDPRHLAEAFDQPGEEPLTMYFNRAPSDRPNPNPFFDARLYTQRFSDCFEDGEDALQHYMRVGHDPTFEPGDNFGQRFYIRKRAAHVRPGRPALVDYFERGRREGASPLPPRPFIDPAAGRTPEELAERIRDAGTGTFTEPRVTIIIPTFGNLTDTLRCVLSVRSASDAMKRTIHVIDDCCPDGTGAQLEQLLGTIEGVSVFQNTENAGFLRTVNAAVDRVETPYLLLLNNDTFVLDGFLDPLVETFERTPNAGAVGSKLLFPNGLLQEAGGVIFADGSAANYGRMDDPNAPEYQFQRDVDYISAASLLIGKQVWDEVGGFSDVYAPAYYEDTDFAMKLRRAGKRLIYQPKSAVVHFEGATCGKDVNAGIKQYQARNKAVFAETWADELQAHGEEGDLRRVHTDRSVKGRILVIDAELPRPDHDSGSVTAFHVLTLLPELGYRVTFMPSNLQFAGKYAAMLHDHGVEVLHAPYVKNGHQFLYEQGDAFDAFWISRAPTAEEYFPLLRDRFPDTPIIFDTVDLHHLRMIREAQLANSNDLLANAFGMRERELGSIRVADLTIVVSTYESSYLRQEIGPFPHHVLPLIYTDPGETPGYKERKDIAFVGSFRHPPNVDAVRYLCEEIWPRALDLGLDADLHIIGSFAPPDLLPDETERVRMVGFVDDLDSYLAGIRVSTAPLRYGAGVKGKVGNAMRLGLPVVGTAMAAEGMGLVDGENVLLGRDPAEFAEKLVALYTDEALWNTVSSNGKAYSLKTFGREAARRTLSEICHFISHPPARS
ncbi:MAG: glycosyltransferase [Pseudomonadota bacterium]